MYIDVDYNPSPSNTFFVSVGLNDIEAVSFDCTTKGQRVLKQALVQKKEDQETQDSLRATSEWDVIELKDGKFLNKRHVKWIDKGQIDQVDGEVWKTEWEKPLNGEAKEKILYYSRLISDNYENLDTIHSEMLEFNIFMSELIEKYK